MTDKRTDKPKPNPVVLPDDACPTCGATMRVQKSTLGLPINGEEILVPDAPHLGCPTCGEVVLRLEDAQRLREAAIAQYRTAHRLFAGHEIRALRDHHGLTQGELAQLLRLGANTLSRWESGRNVQSASMDVLLHLLRDVPGTLEYLRRQVA